MNELHQPSPRSRRVARVAAAVTLALTALAGCRSAEASEVLPVFHVNLGHYTIEPAELTLPAGRFQIIVTNIDSQLAHSLALLKRSTAVLAPGQSQTITIKSGQEPWVGDYVMFCDVPGHRQMGQQGVVHVVAESASVPPTVTP
jgi:uncharacterized cupredoxin-like copper-binding protein